MSAQQRIEKYLALAEQATPGPWVPNTERYYMVGPVASDRPGETTSREVPAGRCFMCLQGIALHKVVTYYGRENGGHVHYDEGGGSLWAITTPEGEWVESNNDADGGGFRSDDDLLFAASSRTEGPAYAKALRAVLAVPERHHIYSDEGDRENDAHDQGWNEALKAVRSAIEQALSEG